MCRYRPSVPLDLVRRQLAFESTSDCREFVTRAGGVITGVADAAVLDSKNSTIRSIRELSSTEEAQLAQAGVDLDTAYADQTVEDDA